MSHSFKINSELKLGRTLRTGPM